MVGMTGREQPVPVPMNDPVREEMRRLAESPDGLAVNRKAQDYYQFDLRITLQEVRNLIVRAAAGEWRLWCGTTSDSPGHIGKTHYFFCPPIEGRDAFVKMEITISGDNLRVFSMHDDTMRGKLR
jgi:hypothetical protein